ncbi:hypothetical protein K457DRAFT_1871901 [Linnemannia elongata AG-77]|uniref:Major facilitator superfamily (MFS) profile domain-containing protein n=1 Tax=Linnemannia elongata AG-77 TaxID=1314771 RepID=A0A197KAZ0_9FUNG|nr:hypothetical protein K457DRAFT_1871901 [Linnemannia elongata AG-77]
MADTPAVTTQSHGIIGLEAARACSGESFQWVKFSTPSISPVSPLLAQYCEGRWIQGRPASMAVFNGFASNPIMMSVGRALQGMGTGFTVQSALGLLTTIYLSGPEHNKALAIFGGTGVIGNFIGNF